MIIVQVQGGLGNQLFQYATARALALRSSSELVLDARFFKGHKLRRYSLCHFATQSTVCEESSGPGVVLPPLSGRLPAYLRWRWNGGWHIRYFRERGLAFDRAVLELGPPTYLQGYWQSERYFLDAADELRRELAICTPPSSENASWLREIASRPAVAVHVRRGDYVSNAKIGRIHGTCSPDYYRRAAELVCSRLAATPTFYVFSDDPAWAAANITLPGETRYVAHNDDRHDYEDLRLMVACRHHIIANSSFSWWGAWLAPNPEKLVIAPARWFRDASKDDRDLIPQSWMRI